MEIHTPFIDFFDLTTYFIIFFLGISYFWKQRNCR